MMSAKSTQAQSKATGVRIASGRTLSRGATSRRRDDSDVASTKSRRNEDIISVNNTASLKPGHTVDNYVLSDNLLETNSFNSTGFFA